MPGFQESKWTRKHTDDRSYVDVRTNGKQPYVIVFVHGIFGSSKSTWEQTPLVLKRLEPLSAFDFADYGYHSARLEHRSPEEFVIQLRTWALAHLDAYETIFFVAHSMGGLFLRHLCIYLANSDQQEGHKLLNRIRHCFLIASPISGSWAATLLRCLGIGFFNTRVPY